MRRWVHQTSFLGVTLLKAEPAGRASSGGAIEEFRCQSCGAGFVLRPRSYIIHFVFAFGLLSMVMCSVVGLVITALAGSVGELWGGLIFTAMLVVPALLWLRFAVGRRRAWTLHPVVAGVGLPPMRYGPVLNRNERARRCGGCGGMAHLQKATRNRTNGIPTGTEYEYSCTGCKRSFTLESVGGTAFAFFGGLVLGGVGLLFVWTKSNDGGALACGGFFFFFWLAAWLMSGWRVARRLRNPCLDLQETGSLPPRRVR